MGFLRDSSVLFSRKQAGPWTSLVLFLLLVGLIAEPALAAKMYWTDNSAKKIQRARLDGTNIQDIVTTGLLSPYGIDLDLVNGKVYWADASGKNIKRANLDGTSVEVLISTGLNIPIGIAVDPAGGKMYWADQGNLRIQRANLDGSSIENLVTTGLNKPYDVALDLNTGKMYFSDWGVQKIMRANLDGTGVEDIVTGLSQVLSVDVDQDGGKLYWTDNGTNLVQRANLDGSSIETLVTLAATATPQGLDLDLVAGKVYWVENATKKIQRANLDGSSIENVISGLALPRFVVIDPLNALPTAANVVLAPASPISTDDLTGSYDYADDDGDTESGTTIRWYRDSTLESAYNDLLTVPASATARNEQWYFEVTPSDGKGSGTMVQSNVVTIQNTAPTAANADLNPDPAYLDTAALALTYDYDDLDDDAESGTQIRWYRNGAVQNAYDDQTSVPISADTPVAGDEWYATVLASDGLATAALLTTTTVTVLNHLTAAIDGPTEIDAMAGDAVELKVTVSGGLAANYTYEWEFTPEAKSEGGPKVDLDGPTVVFDKVKTDDAGLYVCHVSDGFEVVTTDPGVTLNVDAGVPAMGLLGLAVISAFGSIGGAMLMRRSRKH